MGNYPSPTGEARWGLMTIGRVTCSFPWGKVRMGYPTGENERGQMTVF